MRPEANPQHPGGRSSQGFSGLLASSGSLVAPLHRWSEERRNHTRHHQPQELTVRESGAGPTIGLALDVIGVTLLFLYGMPPWIKIPHLEQPYTMFWYTEGSPDQGPPSKEDLERLETLKRRYSRLGSLGYVMVVSGFAMQAVASWMI